MITAPGSQDPGVVPNHGLSGLFLNRCGQKPRRFFLPSADVMANAELSPIPTSNKVSVLGLLTSDTSL